MAIQFATYNDELMEAGKFYLLHVNKDNASALVEVKQNIDLKIPIKGIRYIEILIPENHNPYVAVWEAYHEGEYNIYKDISSSVSIVFRHDGENSKIIIESSNLISGFITIK